MKLFAAGIDIGGTNTKTGIVSDKGEIIERTSFPTADFKKIDDYKSHITEIIREMERKNNISVSGIGIGAPNGNYYTGKIEYAPNLPWQGEIDITRGILPGLTASLTNDANAAAIGEKRFGKAKIIPILLLSHLGQESGEESLLIQNCFTGNTDWQGKSVI